MALSPRSRRRKRTRASLPEGGRTDDAGSRVRFATAQSSASATMRSRSVTAVAVTAATWSAVKRYSSGGQHDWMIFLAAFNGTLFQPLNHLPTFQSAEACYNFIALLNYKGDEHTRLICVPR